LSSWKTYLKKKEKQFAKELYTIFFILLAVIIFLIYGIIMLPNYAGLIVSLSVLIATPLAGWTLGWLYTIKKLWKAS